MTWTRSVLTVAILLFVSGNLMRAQDPPSRNPLDGNPDAIRAGMGMYRVRCADCHGMDARGVRAPDLTQVWASGRSDAGLFQTLRLGVPNTEMPSVGARTTDDEIWRMLAYLRTLAAPTPTETPRGNAENGERIFWATCGGCHRVNDRGGRLGPDLSRIGVARARAAIVRQIRGAVEQFRPGYEPVTLTPSSGLPIHGVKKNEDLFSIQIMETTERIQGYLKGELRDVVNDARSAMPAYGPDRLNDSDLNDLLSYLGGLRGASSSGGK